MIDNSWRKAVIVKMSKRKMDIEREEDQDKDQERDSWRDSRESRVG